MSDRIEIGEAELSVIIERSPRGVKLPLMFGPDVVWLKGDEAPWAVKIVKKMRLKRARKE